MGRRSKSDELGLNQRIVDMHDTDKMTHSEISEHLKDEGIEVLLTLRNADYYMLH